MILARNLSASPTTDGEHWSLQFREEQDVIYTDAYAQDPLPFQRVSSLGNPARRPYPWQPAALVWPSYDALYPSGHGLSYTINPTSSPPTLDVYGELPINAPPTGAPPPPIVPLQATTANTGGSIPPGTYLVAIKGGIHNGPVSNFVTAVIPAGTNTNTITISGVTWRYAAGAAMLYIGTSSLAMTDTTHWSGSSPDALGNNTSFTITDLAGFGHGLPDLNASSLLVQVKNIRHGGVWGDTIGSVAGGTALTFGVPGSGWTTNQWSGYVLSLYFRPGVNFNPGLDIAVTSNTATVLTMAHSGFLAGDVVVLRAKSGSISSNTIGDANFVNAYGPSGLTVNAEVGNLVRIIAGTGTNQPPMAIASNTSTVLTIVGTWYIEPDSTSVFIVETPNWIWTQTAAINNDGTAGSGSFGQSPIVSIQLPALTNYSLLIEGVIVDANGNWSVERYAPIREAYVTQSVTSLKSLAIAHPLTTSGGALGLLTDPTSGIIINGSGQIAVKNGTGIAFDGSGNLTVNAGVGLTIDGGGFLVVNPGTGLSTSGGQVFIPGGAITNTLLAALSVASANIQNGAVGTTHIAGAAITTALIANAAITNALLGTAVVGTANIQNAAITTALIANAAIGTAQISSLDASVITTGMLTVGVSLTVSSAAAVTMDSVNGVVVFDNLSGTNPTAFAASASLVSGSRTAVYGNSKYGTGVTGECSSGGPGPSASGTGVEALAHTAGSIGLFAQNHSGLAAQFDGNVQFISGVVTGLVFGDQPRFNVVGTGANTPALSACPSGAPGAPLWYEVNVNGTLAWAPAWA